MKTLSHAIACILLVYSASVKADTTVSGPYGTILTFAELSPTNHLAVKSKGGMLRLIRQSCEVNSEYKNRNEKHVIEIYHLPEANEIWIGESPEHCVVAHKKIWGLTLRGGNLVIKTSHSTGISTGDESSVVSNYFNQYMQSCASDWQINDKGTMIYLNRIYSGITDDREGAQARIKDVDIQNVQVGDDDDVTVSMKNARNLNFELTLNAESKVISASIDGQSWPILYEEPLMDSVMMEWASPTTFDIPSDIKDGNIISCSRSYGITNRSDPGFGVVSRAVVSPSTGALWIGPVECKLVMVDGTIFGFLVDGDGTHLLVYKGLTTTIPKSSQSTVVFKNELIKYDKALISRNFQNEASASINLKDVLTDSVFSNTARICSLRKCLVRNKNIVIIILDSSVLQFSEIVMDANFRVLSTRVLDKSTDTGLIYNVNDRSKR